MVDPRRDCSGRISIGRSPHPSNHHSIKHGESLVGVLANQVNSLFRVNLMNQKTPTDLYVFSEPKS